MDEIELGRYFEGHRVAASQCETHSCNCVGPQNGNPVCPCMMRGHIERETQRRKAALWDAFIKQAKPRIRVKAGRRVAA